MSEDATKVTFAVDADLDAKMVRLVLTHAGADAQLPIEPQAARLLASSLLVAARHVDPSGHIQLFEQMARELLEQMLLQTIPDGAKGH